MSDIKGSIVITDRAGARIHTYAAPEDGWRVTSHIVEGPTRLVLFDGQLINAYADEVADYAAAIGKPVDRIIVSHGHPDHWAGLEILARRFPEVPIHALEGVSAFVQQAGPTMLAGLQRLLGDRVASTVTRPTHALTVGATVIDGIRFKFQEVLDAESDRQLVALLPEQRVILAFDLVFSARQHLFTTTKHFDHWIGLLDELKRQQGCDLLLIGHDAPVDFSAIDATIAYLRRAAQIYAASTSGADYAAALKAAFPERADGAWADFSGRRLFPAPQA